MAIGWVNQPKGRPFGYDSDVTRTAKKKVASAHGAHQSLEAAIAKSAKKPAESSKGKKV